MFKKLSKIIFISIILISPYRGWGKTSFLKTKSDLNTSNIKFIEDKNSSRILLWENISLNEGLISQFYTQKLDKNGNVAWKADIQLSNRDYQQVSHQLISDGQGGVIITWEEKDPVSEKTDVLAQRIDKMGNKLWGPYGQVLSKIKSNKISPLLISDGTSGAIFVWSDSRNDLTCKNWDIYAQHLSAEGKYLWNDGGIVISADINDEFVGQILSSEEGDISIIWNKVIPNDFSDMEGYDFCYKKINSKGKFIRAATFLNLPATENNYELAGDIISDDNNGFFIGLARKESNREPVLYLQHIKETDDIVVTEKYAILIDSLVSDIKSIGIQQVNSEIVINWNEIGIPIDTITQTYAYQEAELPEDAIIIIDTLQAKYLLPDYPKDSVITDSVTTNSFVAIDSITADTLIAASYNDSIEVRKDSTEDITLMEKPLLDKEYSYSNKAKQTINNDEKTYVKGDLPTDTIISVCSNSILNSHTARLIYTEIRGTKASIVSVNSSDSANLAKSSILQKSAKTSETVLYTNTGISFKPKESNQSQNMQSPGLLFLTH